jgi:hypothetical protein
MRVQGQEAAVAGPQQVSNGQLSGRIVRPEGREDTGWCAAVLIVGVFFLAIYGLSFMIARAKGTM